MKENETNILAENVKIPQAWTQTGSSNLHRMTKRKLEMQRLQAKHPHKSYDLDGDGAVSVKDYFLAKQFDKDGDGKLNETELANAKKALAEGYADRFMFGLERAGSMPLSTSIDASDLGNKKVPARIDHLRIVQVKGKTIVAEDFAPLAPKPVDRPQALIRTKSALQAKRKQENVT